ncbi:MAG: hypothetical protein ABFR75_04175 [Acidobacteriota bacterium]
MSKRSIVFFIVLFIACFSTLAGVDVRIDDSSKLGINVDIRSFYLNDQRIQWSGQEATFGVEGLLNSTLERRFKNGIVEVSGEFELNQPFDDNILVDEFREKYLQNFTVDPFKISQLYIGIRLKNFEIFFGKKDSPFGSDHSVFLSNSRYDHPFIRTEAILWQETGLFFKYSSGIFTADLAIVNGGSEQDTNSSKAGIVRIGLGSKKFSAGISAKFQDGIGSEQQKVFKNHIGFDAKICTGNFTISGELIYDEYGFRKEFDSDNIFWKRSFYYRDIFFKFETPVTGFGGYFNINYSRKKLLMNINYGEFHPEEIGNPLHDTPVKRLIAKVIVELVPGFDIFLVGIGENERPKEPVFSGASSYAFSFGLRFRIK